MYVCMYVCMQEDSFPRDGGCCSRHDCCNDKTPTLFETHAERLRVDTHTAGLVWRCGVAEHYQVANVYYNSHYKMCISSIIRAVLPTVKPVKLFSGEKGSSHTWGGEYHYK